MLKLSRRLQAICDMVETGSRICDVGCDHAFVEIRLLQEGRIRSALAMDVSDGPLGRAESNLMLTELTSRCELRKSDGLAAYGIGEADTLICTGIGGLLMKSILDAEPLKTESFSRMVLSPQSEIHVVREELRNCGIGITDELFLKDQDKYYTVINAEPGHTGVRPDWVALADKTHGLSEAETDQLRIDRDSFERLIRDPEFCLFAENLFGPSILQQFLRMRTGGQNEDSEIRGESLKGTGYMMFRSETAGTFMDYLTRKMRSEMAVSEKLAGFADSDDALRRLNEIHGEIGIMQAVLASHVIAEV